MTDTTKQLTAQERLAAARSAVREAGIDFNKAEVFVRDLPDAGPTRVRLIEYIEFGKHKTTFQNVTKFKPKARLTFELSGPKHAPKKQEDGSTRPYTLSLDVDISRNSKANFYKLFQQLKGERFPDAQHFVDILGEAWKATVYHRKYAKKGEDKADESKWTGVACEFKDPKTKALSFAAPLFERIDPETQEPTGEFAPLTVPPPLSQLRWFLWDAPTKEDWDTLFIDGEYEERKNEKGEVISPARSKNYLQMKILEAENFKGSEVDAMIQRGGVNIDFAKLAGAVDGQGGTDDQDEQDHDEEAAHPGEPPAKTAEPLQGQAADDALSGVGV